MKVFLSWSGDVSLRVASALRKWLPYFIQPLKPFLSSIDISKGDRWNDALAKELEDSDYGIVCVTPYNINKVWMNFEAGALSKRFDRAHLMPFLFRLERPHIEGPIGQFQSTLCNEDDFLNLLYSMNSLGDCQLDHELLRDTFKAWWPQLKNTLDQIPPTALGETRTCYPWLYTTEDLAIHGLAQTKCIWIISMNTQLLSGAFRQAVIGNLLNGISYKCFLPDLDRTDGSEKATLDELANFKGSGSLLYRFFNRTQFEMSAATDYVIINPDIPLDDTGIRRRMFLRLPIQPTGADYWIEVEENSTRSFAARFRELWDTPGGTSSP
jgi:hypothetical protein